MICSYCFCVSLTCVFKVSIFCEILLLRNTSTSVLYFVKRFQGITKEYTKPRKIVCKFRLTEIFDNYRHACESSVTVFITDKLPSERARDIYRLSKLKFGFTSHLSVHANSVKRIIYSVLIRYKDS